MYAPAAHAQFIGFTSPQTVDQKIISAATGPQVTPNQAAFPCTPTALAPCAIPNLGQTIHSVVYQITGTCTSPTLDLRIEASNDGTNFFAISQDAIDIPTNPVSQTAKSGGVTAIGSFAVFRANLVAFSCTGGGTISAWYAGTSSTVPTDSAIFQQANIGRQTLWQNVATNTALGSVQISTPFENASGSIWIMCSASCPSGMSIVVSALPLVNVTSPPSFTLSTIPVAQVTGWQKFDITDAPTNVVQLTVTPGAGGKTWTAIYNFVPSTSQVNGSVNLNCLNGCFGSITNPGDPCQSSSVPKLSVPIVTSTAATLVAGVANESIYACGYSFTLSGSTSLIAQFVSGTNTSTPCDTGTASLTGQYATGMNGIFIGSEGGGYAVFTAPAGKDVCILATGTTPNANGVFTYVQK